MSVTIRRTLRPLMQHTGPILVGKVLQYVGSLLFAILVPRLMGPEAYGPLAVYISFLIILSMLGDFGTLPIYGRFVPIFLTEGKSQQVRQLFTQLLLLKSGVALLIGLLCVSLGQFILPMWPTSWLWLGAVTLLLRIAADNFYHLAFGLDDMARWIARESLRSLVQFALLLPLFFFFGLLGAIVGLFLSDLAFLLFGLSWGRLYWAWDGWHFDFLRPYLRYGAAFFVASACLMIFQRGGDVLLAAWQVAPAEIAYFDLAFNVFLILYATMTQLVMSAVPTLTSWLTVGREEQVCTVLNLLWKGSLLAAILIIAVIWTLADDLVLLMFGSAYMPVAPLLRLVVLNLLPLALGQMSFVVAAVYRRPTIRMWASVITLIVFVGLAIALIPTYGASGLARASLCAMSVYAVMTYWLSRPLLRLGGWQAELIFLRNRFW